MSWRRKKLYLLLAQHRYISRLFSVLIGSDIADKLYALNDRVYIGKRYHCDIRLPNFLQMSSPEMSKSSLTEHFQNSRRYCDKWHQSFKLYNYKRLSSSFPKWNSKIQQIELTNIFINPTQRQDAIANCFIHLNLYIVNKFYNFFFCISHWNIWRGVKKLWAILSFAVPELGEWNFAFSSMSSDLGKSAAVPYWVRCHFSRSSQ